MKEKLLITGVSVFLGGSFKDFLHQKKSFGVFGVDLKCDLSDKGNICCDLCNEKEATELLMDIRPDTIFHFAGGRAQNEDVFLKSNLMSKTFNVLRKDTT